MRVCHTEMAANGENVRWVTIYVCFGMLIHCLSMSNKFLRLHHMWSSHLWFVSGWSCGLKSKVGRICSKFPSTQSTSILTHPTSQPVLDIPRTPRASDTGTPCLFEWGRPDSAIGCQESSHWMSGSSKHGQNHLLVLTQSIMSTMIIIVLVRPGVIGPSESCKPLYCFFTSSFSISILHWNHIKWIQMISLLNFHNRSHHL